MPANYIGGGNIQLEAQVNLVQNDFRFSGSGCYFAFQSYLTQVNVHFHRLLRKKKNIKQKQH